MEFVFSKGKNTRQAHVGIPAGTFEEEHGRETFFGRASHLYRTHPPTAWTRIDGPLRPRALDLNEMKPEDSTDAGATWQLVAGNEDVRLFVSRRAAAMPYFLRDADGDVCYFVHRGTGTIETDYGPLSYEKGDYVIVPKGTTHRIVPESDDNFFFVIEGAGEFRIPERGLMGRHAQFDPGVLEVPDPDPHDEAGEFEVRVKRDDSFTSLWFAWHPLDVVGWQGDLCPVKLNVLQHRPVYSPSYHMPPSAHCTFKNEGFVICSFVPRPLEEDPAVLFYHSGDYFSRAGIDEGYMTIHPQGVHHGPQPAAIEASKTKERTDEIAVMVETENPLVLSSDAEAVVITEYETSWARGMGLLE